MGRIRVLPRDVVEKISAGEVVEDPSSVVKELIENSIDAKAKRILVEIIEGGKTLIMVVDDGEGILSDDVEIAVRRHATSKIWTADDIDRVETLGFRGEALASICAVSKTVIETRAREEEKGTLLRVDFGRVVEKREISRPVGTAVKVYDLFANLPARRKFLKSAHSEAKRVAVTVERYAVAFPEISFTLVSNGRKILWTSGSGDPRSAVGEIWGSSLEKGLIDSGWESFDDIRGRLLLSRPSTRGSRSSWLLFVNRRPVEAKDVSWAVMNFVLDKYPKGTYPFVVLFLEVPPGSVDVNVHPKKMEVRFRDQGKVFALIKKIGEKVGDRLGPYAGATVVQMDELRGAPNEPKVVPLVRASRGPRIRWGTFEPAPTPKLPEGWRILGQVALSYILVETKEGVLFVDQHTAHEKVIYEELVKKIKSRQKIVSQRLLFPQVVELSASELEALEMLEDVLKDVGFEIQRFGENAVVIRGVPSVLGPLHPGEAEKTLREILSEPRKESPQDALFEVLKTVSCRSAIKAGRELSWEEMEELIGKWVSLENPMVCPHGRPIAVLVGFSEVNKRLQREG